MNWQVIYGLFLSLFAAKGILSSLEWLYFRVYGKMRGWGRAVIDSKTIITDNGERAVSVTVNIHGGFNEGIAKGMIEGATKASIQMSELIVKNGGRK